MVDTLDVDKWIRFAQNDFDLAVMASERFRPFIEGACYHCQQTAEKILKAYILAQTGSRTKTHDATKLKPKPSQKFSTEQPPPPEQPAGLAGRSSSALLNPPLSALRPNPAPLCGLVGRSVLSHVAPTCLSRRSQSRMSDTVQYLIGISIHNLNLIFII
jgi:hypothetical protein